MLLDIILLVAIVLILPPVLAVVLGAIWKLWQEFIIWPIQHRWAVFQNNRLNGRKR